MNIGLDNRAILVKLVKHMTDSDIQQMLAYASGYEAGKISQASTHIIEQSDVEADQIRKSSAEYTA